MGLINKHTQREREREEGEKESGGKTYNKVKIIRWVFVRWALGSYKFKFVFLYLTLAVTHLHSVSPCISTWDYVSPVANVALLISRRD